jgi:glucokinase
MAEKDPKVVLAYDLGGTKVSVGAVTSKGKVLEEIRVPVLVEKGKAAVIRQLSDLGKDIISRHKGIKKVGMASAGPLDPDKGVLLDPTNFASESGTWGQVPIASLLSKALKKKVYLENDAAAAMLAEQWIGHAKGYNNSMILTLGTGLGTGIIINGKLVRAIKGLHPEAGHMIIHYNDQSAPCGCGNLGCAEAYLSGRGFTRRSRPRFANPNLLANDIAAMAHKRDPRALAAFEEYAQIMAVTLHNYAVMFAPEIIVFTGSFAATADLFIDSTREHLEKLLVRRRIGFDLMPELKVSKLDNMAGLIGAAKVAFDRD